MKKLFVNVNRGYEIIISREIINNCGEYIKKVSNARRVCVITDSNVEKLYLADVTASLEKEGFECSSFVFEAGEKSKRPEAIIEIADFMAEKGLNRKDLVVALGGGVTGDMAGFAAASYLRGIDFVQIPTTLLSQVDSSVGGKTGVDLKAGKNLFGAFHQPILVLIDPNVLETLSEHYFSDGMAEVIKYGCIKSRSFFERLEKENAKDFIEELIFKCVDIKRRVVENDEKEHGERALLNFGHTVGHAIEKLWNFEGISHGEAVGIGMVQIARAGEKNGITEPGTADRIVSVLKKYSLKTELENSMEDIIGAMSADKKRISSGINFVVLSEIGKSYVLPVENEKIPELFGVNL